MTATETAAVEAITNLSTGVIKLGQELKARLAAAPKPVDKTEVEKTASVLVNYGLISEAQREKAVQVLSDPGGLHETLRNVVEKYASDMHLGDGRLATGQAVKPSANGHQANTGVKAAATESDADRQYGEKLRAYRNGRA